MKIKIQIVPTRSGCWKVMINGWRAIKSSSDPLTEIASRMIAAGHKRDARIVMTRTPDGPCRVASTLGDTVMAGDRPQRQPFRAPDWVALQANGGTQ